MDLQEQILKYVEETQPDMADITMKFYGQYDDEDIFLAVEELKLQRRIERRETGLRAQYILL